MYITEYGSFDGNRWEEFCQLCFKKKYESEGYQEMPATFKGDLGIEGYTRSGRVFQCYCPDMEYEPKKLYEEQRDKITLDLNKLIANSNELKTYLNGTKVKEWIFVTPGYTNKDLVKHCVIKANELRALNADHLDPNFDVLVHDIEYFSSEIPIVLNFRNEKLSINTKNAASEEVLDWKNKEISLVENAVKKHTARIPSNKPNVDAKVNQLTQKTIQDYLDGDVLIRKWSEKYQDHYEKFIEVVDLFERNVEEQCAVHDGSNQELYNKIASELREKLKSTFGFLDEVMIDKLTNRVMADWILRCPINFD